MGVNDWFSVCYIVKIHTAVEYIITNINGIIEAFEVVVIADTQYAAVKVDIAVAVVERVAQIQAEAQAVHIELQVHV